MSKGVNRTRLNNRTDDKPNASCAAAISVAGLWKRYGATAAVCDVSFEVGAGQIFGLLGANGAGKTTTLECILGLRQPDGGSIQIDGLDLRTHAAQVKRLVGAQLQAATLQDKITPRQALDLFGSFYSQSFGSDELLARFDLEAKADVPFATLSGGLRQRLFLALALNRNLAGRVDLYGSRRRRSAPGTSMIQRGQHLRLQRETREPLGIVGEAIGKDFDGDVAIN